MTPVSEIVDGLEASLARMQAAARELEANPVKRAERDARIAEDRARDHRFKVESLRSDWNAPKRHVQHTVNDASPIWTGHLDSLAKRIGSGFLVALIGSRGNGKTQLAVEIMRQATEALRPALFTTATDFFLQVKDTFNRDTSRTERDVVKRFAMPDLLVIDEAGKRGGSEWENNLLFELINRRYNNILDTILTDNADMAGFAANVGPSICSRINETGGILVCDWPSFRPA